MFAVVKRIEFLGQVGEFRVRICIEKAYDVFVAKMLVFPADSVLFYNIDDVVFRGEFGGLDENFWNRHVSSSELYSYSTIIVIV